MTAALSLVVALVGLINRSIYENVVQEQVLPGMVSQDLLTILAAFVVFYLVARMDEQDTMMQMVMLGLVGFFFYAYGIYVIEQVYNLLYYIYIAIFSLSFYSLVFSVMSIRIDKVLIEIPAKLRWLSAGFLAFIPLLFIPLWVVSLFPLLTKPDRIENLFSIYILDLVFILPFSVITLYLLVKNSTFGLLLTPAFFVKGFTLLFSVALGSAVQPFLGVEASVGDFFFYLSLSVVFLVLTGVYIRYAKTSIVG